MHTITVTFEDKEFELLQELKKKSWHDFILGNAKDAKALKKYLELVESGEITIKTKTGDIPILYRDDKLMIVAGKLI